MKTISCQHCEDVFTAATKEEILGELYDHYMKDHNEVITTVDDAGKKAWMEAFETQWKSAQESE